MEKEMIFEKNKEVTDEELYLAVSKYMTFFVNRLMSLNNAIGSDKEWSVDMIEEQRIKKEDPLFKKTLHELQDYLILMFLEMGDTQKEISHILGMEHDHNGVPDIFLRAMELWRKEKKSNVVPLSRTRH